MAVPKGNAIALQALKPLPEIKVADLAANIISTFEKTQAAKEAARLKALEEERKGIREFVDKSQVKSFATIPSITDQSSQLFRDTADYIGELGIMAEKDPSNKYHYQSLIQKASNNYNSLATTFGNAEFIKKAQEKLESFQNQDYFMESDAKDRLELISKGMLKMQMDKSSGEIKFALPRNANATPDEKTKWYTAGEVQSWYTTPEELDWMNTTKANGGNTFPKELSDTAKVFADEWSRNTDGNRTTEWSGFAKERATAWFDSRFGGFKAGAVDARLNQFAKKTIGSEIDSEEEYNQVKDAIIANIGSQVPTKKETDTKLTAADQEYQRLRNIRLKQEIAEGNRPKTTTGQSTTAGPQMYNSANQQAFVQVTGSGGKVIGVRPQEMRILSLPKLKGQPATTNVFGTHKYRNKNGELVTAYYLGTPAKNGKTVTSRISENELNGYFVKLGYNPIVAKAYLLEENGQNTVPIITPSTKYQINTDYQKVDVFLKVKMGAEEE